MKQAVLYDLGTMYSPSPFISRTFMLAVLVMSGMAHGEQERQPDARAAQQFLQNLAGTWMGEYRIRTPDARTLDRIDVEEHYTWREVDDRVFLQGRAVMHSSGRLTHSSSQTWLENGVLWSEVEQGEQIRRYRGELTADGAEVSWRPAGRRIGQRMTQRLGRENSRDILIISGYEDYQQQGVGTLLMIDAKLYRQAEEVTLPKPRRDY